MPGYEEGRLDVVLLEELQHALYTHGTGENALEKSRTSVVQLRINSIQRPTSGDVTGGILPSIRTKPSFELSTSMFELVNLAFEYLLQHRYQPRCRPGLFDALTNGLAMTIASSYLS